MSSPTRRAKKRKIGLRGRAAPGPSGGVPMETVRNLCRHKLRSSLTVSGIVIGVLAITTMGAFAESFNALLDGRVQYFGSNVQAGPPAGQAASLLPPTKTDDIRPAPGLVPPFPIHRFPPTPPTNPLHFPLHTP